MIPEFHILLRVIALVHVTSFQYPHYPFNILTIVGFGWLKLLHLDSRYQIQSFDISFVRIGVAQLLCGITRFNFFRAMRL